MRLSERVCASAILLLAMAAGPAVAGYTGSDDFNDGVINSDTWDGPFMDSAVECREQDGRLQFRSTAAESGFPTAEIQWDAFDCVNGYDWSATVDVNNPSDLLPGVADPGEEEVSSVSIVLTPSNLDDSFLTLFLQTKIYVYNDSTRSAHRIILGKWTEGTDVTIQGDILYDFPSDLASLGYRWDAATGELDVLYDENGGQDSMVLWHTLDMSDWAMGPSDEFGVDIEGTVTNAVVDWSGGMYADDFVATSEVPEPATLGLLALGGLGIVALRRTRTA